MRDDLPQGPNAFYVHTASWDQGDDEQIAGARWKLAKTSTNQGKCQLLTCSIAAQSSMT